MKYIIIILILLFTTPAMALDISLYVMAFPSTHDLPPEKEYGRYKRGDIVDVYRRSQVITTTKEGQRCVYVHITGVPAPAIRNAKKLMQGYYDVNDETLLGRRLFNIDPQTIPLALRQELAANREITVTWTQAKPYLKNLKTGLAVTNEDVE